jgi:hypothetical protein
MKGTGFSMKGTGFSVKGTGFSPYIKPAQEDWVPHPWQAFVFLPRVGDHNSQKLLKGTGFSVKGTGFSPYIPPWQEYRL